jgi:Ankyrin repeats (3 copies)
MNSISEFDILTLNLAEIKDGSSEIEDDSKLKTAKEQISYSKSKVLRLSNSQSVRTAVEFLIKAHSEINLSPFIFVVIIEARKPENETENHALKISEINKFITREIIIQVLQGSEWSTFVREEKCEDENIPSLIEIKFDDEIDDRSLGTLSKHLNIKFLLKSLYNEIGGSCSGMLLKTKIDTRNSELLEVAVRSGNILCLKFLNLFNWNLEDKSRSLEISVQCNQLDLVKILLDVPIQSCDDLCIQLTIKRHQYLLERVNEDGNSILMVAAESGSLNIVEFLLNFHFNLEAQNLNGDRASDLASKNLNFGVLCELLKYDSPFPQFLLPIEYGNYNDFVSKREDFHSLIEYGEIDEVKKFVAENPLLRFGYNDQNVSAVTVALVFKKFEIYSYLRSQGFSNGVDTTSTSNQAC